MSAERGRKPDYNLWAVNPDETCKGTIGGAWINDDQSINIKLNAFVVLEAADGLTVKLFPNDGKFEERQAAKKERAKAKADDLEDDIPF